MRNRLAQILPLMVSLLIGLPQLAPAQGPYKVSKVVKVGGEGTYDTGFADVDARRLYIPRKNPGRITVFNLDTLEPVGEIPDAAANGVVVDPKSGHGFASSKPVTMFDAKTLKTIKTIDVQGGPDAILFDPFTQRVFIFSHTAPNATVINAVDGAVLGTVDLGGEPEQATTDRNGKIYVDVRDKNDIAVIDAKTLTVSALYRSARRWKVFRARNGCEEPNPVLCLPDAASDGDSQCRRWEDSQYSANWIHRGFRHLQPVNQRSLQCPDRWNADGC
jgi:hypothetical protein